MILFSCASRLWEKQLLCSTWHSIWHFKANKTVAIFSLEMSKEQLVNRLFALESQVDSQALRTGNLKDSDWEKLIESAGTIGKSN